MKQILTTLVLTALFASCSVPMFSRLNGKSMSLLDLGMPKEQLIEILGKHFTIPEKRLENGKLIEVLSYRNYPETNEFYLFVFVNNELEEWYREFVPVYEIRED